MSTKPNDQLSFITTISHAESSTIDLSFKKVLRNEMISFLQRAEKQWICIQNGIAEILVFYRFLHSLFICPKCEKYCHFNFA